MVEFFSVLIGLALVNHFVLARSPTACPLSISSSEPLAAPLSRLAAIAGVLAMASAAFSLTERWLPGPLGRWEWRLLAGCLAVLGAAKLLGLLLRGAGVSLARSAAAHSALLTGNCVVLGLSLFMTIRSASPLNAVAYGAGTGVAFALTVTVLAELAARLEPADLPVPLRGPGIALVNAALLSLALTGLVRIAGG